jgi:hypothetical protein
MPMAAEIALEIVIAMEEARMGAVEADAQLNYQGTVPWLRERPSEQPDLSRLLRRSLTSRGLGRSSSPHSMNSIRDGR